MRSCEQSEKQRFVTDEIGLRQRQRPSQVFEPLDAPSVPLSRRGVLAAGAVIGGLVSSSAWAAAQAVPPSRTAIDGRTAALVSIDLQNSSRAVPWLDDSFDLIVARTNTLAEAIRAAGGVVIHTRTFDQQVPRLPADIPAPDLPTTPDPDDLAPELSVKAEDAVVSKRQWGAFYATDLDEILRRHGIATLILAGVATEVGVESTAREAHDRGYGLIFAADAMGSVSDAGRRSFFGSWFPRIGRVRTVDAIRDALRP